MRKLVVYAIGGNALATPDGHSHPVEQESSAEVLARVMSDIIDLLEMDWSVVVTHGNGPQVGLLLALDEGHHYSMDEWVAATQGMIGHQLCLNLQAILERRRRPERAVIVVTRVEVDAEDAGFAWPSKPVGPVLDAETVMSVDWDIAQTIHGPRRVVASPKPVHILDLEVIHHLVDLHAVVICGGGGGIPVVRQDGILHGVAAVIDKDLFSSRLAQGLEADALIISTNADAIYKNFGKEDAKAISSIDIKQLRSMSEEGQFPAGSMAPKVNALSEFILANNSGLAFLCSPGYAAQAMRGESGTRVVNSLD